MHNNTIAKKFWIFTAIVGLVTFIVSAFLFDPSENFKAWLFNTFEILIGTYLNPYREKYVSYLYGKDNNDF